jgi:uncharacterized protein DUF4271
MSITFKNFSSSIYFCKNNLLVKQVFIFLVLNFFLPALPFAQQPDSTRLNVDSGLIKKDSTTVAADTLQKADTTRIVSPIPVFHFQNKLLNTKGEPVSLAVQYKKTTNKDVLFYMVMVILLVLGFFKYFYDRYFTNLFRVFFNTSLRQSQLTDQLLQAKFPSLVFNLFFILSGGFYAYILFSYYGWINESNKWIMLGSLIALLGLINLVKFSTLKFTGWITGLKEVTNIYVFIIFLINKIIGVFLVPFIVILSFSDNYIVRVAVLVSLMSIILLLFLRFFRSYGLLQNQLKISRFHFILYIAGVEILPLLLIYKGLMIYLSKNL